MENEITISVTQEDIDEGQPASPVACPINLAARRVFPGKEIGVGLATLRVGADLDTADYYTLPIEASRFIKAFDGWPFVHIGATTGDGRHLVKPFTFTAYRSLRDFYVD